MSETGTWINLTITKIAPLFNRPTRARALRKRQLLAILHTEHYLLWLQNHNSLLTSSMR
jgi:hypothetical protein